MSARRLILAPLSVMLLLTILVGYTAYQQSQDWKEGVSRITDNISRLVVLNNIQWGLRKVQRDLHSDPNQANATWQTLRPQIRVLIKLQQEHHQNQPQGNTSTIPLEGLLQIEKPTPAIIQSLVKSDFFSPKLEQIDELKALQAEAAHATNLVTLSMIALGMVLTGLTAYEVDRLFSRLARSRDLNIRLQEEERRRIAQDLHDGVVQELIDLKRHYTPEKVDAVIQNLRRVCHNLKPQVLEDLGLAAALEFLADDLRQFGIPDVQLHVDRDGLKQLPKLYELPLFRVTQELCSNIKHHAGATRVKVTIAYNPSESTVLSGHITDNGKGFNPQQVESNCMGLAGVKERLQQIDGQVFMQSQPGHGCHVQLIVPVKRHVAS